MKKPLPPVLRAALYRRAVACAWLTLCERQHRYGLNYEKRHTKQGIQTNLSLKEESYGDWLPKCDDPAAT